MPDVDIAIKNHKTQVTNVVLFPEAANRQCEYRKYANWVESTFGVDVNHRTPDGLIA
ncbi:hypothetical protein H2248_012363 [Termitomyces sp. 'cryptogamus']|nr:hypothetical protein H2248_012363 [Termitomyces sp. 'cryptogamus']